MVGRRVRIRIIKGDPVSERLILADGKVGVVTGIGDRIDRVMLDSGDVVLVLHREIEPE